MYSEPDPMQEYANALHKIEQLEQELADAEQDVSIAKLDRCLTCNQIEREICASRRMKAEQERDQEASIPFQVHHPWGRFR